jgi:hypothetical protein
MHAIDWKNSTAKDDAVEKHWLCCYLGVGSATSIPLLQDRRFWLLCSGTLPDMAL